ncbi:hypothetical protein [Kurthia sibirica]|uniref:Uncharacterized protein n=1 Tax=Kurthia sibirica TaxID=202750 RepID=A0A2U3ALM5_9BACL|nr:hypothetical protein [Kurthia sibirica]PWI25451.1 hypothetical protein DEX24_07540 [Kurthia sibirica]GEK34968.1 hypothetical protein KSI01_25010 [Kurthia sibirica]
MINWQRLTISLITLLFVSSFIFTTVQAKKSPTERTTSLGTGLPIKGTATTTEKKAKDDEASVKETAQPWSMATTANSSPESANDSVFVQQELPQTSSAYSFSSLIGFLLILCSLFLMNRQQKTPA